MLPITQLITISFLVCFGHSVAGIVQARMRMRFDSKYVHLIINFTAQSDEGPTIDMLNAMQQLMTGDAEYFDPAFLEELLQVFKIHLNLAFNPGNVYSICCLRDVPLYRIISLKLIHDILTLPG